MADFYRVKNPCWAIVPLSLNDAADVPKRHSRLFLTMPPFGLNDKHIKKEVIALRLNRKTSNN